MRNKGAIISTTLLIILTCGALFFVKDFVQAAWTNQLPDSISSCIDGLYPRFQTEKHRLPIEFFIDKAHLVLIRTLFVEFGILILLFLKSRQKKFQISVINTAHSYKTIIFVYYGFMLITTYDWFWELKSLQQLAPFYKPVLLLSIFGSILAESIILQGIYILMILLCLATLLGKGLKWTPTIVIILFIYLEATFNSFEKINHGYATFIYTGMLFPVYLFNPKERKWVISLIQIVIAACYFLAGLEKLTISGGDWLSAVTMSTYLSRSDTSVGLWMSQQPILCLGLSVGAILFQLTFPLVLFLRRFKSPILISGIIFHWGTVVLFGISSFINPWLVVYVFFIDTEKVLDRIKDLWKPQSQALDPNHN